MKLRAFQSALTRGTGIAPPVPSGLMLYHQAAPKAPLAWAVLWNRSPSTPLLPQHAKPLRKADRDASSSSFPNPAPSMGYGTELLQITYMTKPKCLMAADSTGEELTKLPTQLIAVIALPAGSEAHFVLSLHISRSCTEAGAAQHHHVYHNPDLYLEYETCVSQSIPEPFWRS